MFRMPIPGPSSAPTASNFSRPRPTEFSHVLEGISHAFTCDRDFADFLTGGGGTLDLERSGGRRAGGKDGHTRGRQTREDRRTVAGIFDGGAVLCHPPEGDRAPL